jgi:hypothetical protein
MINSNSQAKNYHSNQMAIYFNYLKKHIATNSMVTDATGIPQKNLTRYKRYFQIAGSLFEVRKGICKKTKHTATYLTTNKNLIPIK